MHARNLGAMIMIVASGLAGCGDSAAPDHLRIPNGDPKAGRALIYAYGCGTCHTVEGVPGARGTVGPTLNDYAERTLLAGVFPNVPPVLISWLMDPVALIPSTGMPAMGITRAEARDIAAYLYTLGAADAKPYPPEPPVALQGLENPVLEKSRPLPMGRGFNPLLVAPTPD